MIGGLILWNKFQSDLNNFLLTYLMLILVLGRSFWHKHFGNAFGRSVFLFKMQISQHFLFLYHIRYWAAFSPFKTLNKLLKINLSQCLYFLKDRHCDLHKNCILFSSAAAIWLRRKHVFKFSKRFFLRNWYYQISFIIGY